MTETEEPAAYVSTVAGSFDSSLAHGKSRDVQETGGRGRTDILGWSLALSPLLMPIAAFALACTGTIARPRSITLLSAAAAAAIIVADKQQIAASGRAGSRALPSGWWAVFPSIYLWKRARILGLSSLCGWAWLACAPLSLFLYIFAIAVGAAYVADVPSIPQTAAAVLPSCAAPETRATLQSLFNGLPEAHAASLTAVSVSKEAEMITQEEGGLTRRCTASILDSGDHENAIDYTLENRDGEVLIHLQIR